MIPVAQPDIGPLEEEYVRQAVRSGWVSSLGHFIQRFEKDYAAFCEVEQAVAVSNGTDALFLVLKAMGVGTGDEVIIPDLTFAAVGAVVLHLGAEPVLVDVDPEYWCLDPRAVQRAICDKTKVIVVVHSYGHPADLDPIIDLARQRDIRVVEDCAQAHGARYKGRRVGSLGAAGVFSLYANKILTTGEGGVVTTRDSELVGRVRLLKDHAMSAERRYFHTEAGHNCRLTNLQAALGCAQLERFEALSASKQEVLANYRVLWGDDPRLTFNPSMEWAEPAMWMVCGMIPEGSATRLDQLLPGLAEMGIDTRPFFVPLSEMPPYRHCRTVGAEGNGTPVAASLSRRGFNLPSGHGLDGAAVDWVVSILRQSLQ